MRSRGARAIQYRLMFTVAVAGAGILSRKLLERGWERGVGRPVPEGLGLRRDRWREALVWGAISGVTVGLARLAAQETVYQLIDSSDFENVGDVLDVD